MCHLFGKYTFVVDLKTFMYRECEVPLCVLVLKYIIHTLSFTRYVRVHIVKRPSSHTYTCIYIYTYF